MTRIFSGQMPRCTKPILCIAATPSNTGRSMAHASSARRVAERASSHSSSGVPPRSSSTAYTVLFASTTSSTASSPVAGVMRWMAWYRSAKSMRVVLNSTSLPFLGWRMQSSPRSAARVKGRYSLMVTRKPPRSSTPPYRMPSPSMVSISPTVYRPPSILPTGRLPAGFRPTNTLPQWGQLVTCAGSTFMQ